MTLTGALASGQIAGLKPAAGSAASGKITVPAGSDAGTDIPVIVLRGAKPGPTMAIIAGMSGTAYSPFLTAQQLPSKLTLKELSGTVVVIPLANLPAFAERTGYLNPIDRKDLNRAFPGRPDGTSSERIAYAITTQVIEPSDSVVILEAGGSNASLVPHVYQAISGDAKLDAKIASMALEFGISYIVMDRSVKTSKVSPESAALERSKPVLKVMCGSGGAGDQRMIDTMTKGLLSMMTLFDMVPGHSTKTRSPQFFDRVTSVESPQTGFIASFVVRGQNVKKGEPIFGVSGYDGKNPLLVQSPLEGILLSIISTPPVNKGETAALIGTPREP